MNKNKKQNNKKKQRKTSTAIVVYNPRQASRGKKQVPRPLNDVYARYQAALRNPFSDFAYGCRVPDQYSVPTSTFHLRARATLQFDSGAGSVMFTASPFSAMMSTSTVLTSSFGATTAISGAIVHSMSTISELRNCLSSYRVVSYGIKLTNLTPALSAAGYVEGYETAGNQYPPMWPCFDATTSINQYASHMSNDNGSYSAGFTGVSNKPGAAYINVQGMMNNELLLTPRICSAQAFSFRTTSRLPGVTSSTFEVISGEIGANTGSVIALSSEAFMEQTSDGWNTIILNVGGGPSAGAMKFGVEIIYHLEGTPTQSSATQPIASAGVGTLIGSRSRVDDIVANVSGSPYYQFIKDAFNFGANSLSTIAQTPVGQQLAIRGMAVGARYLRGPTSAGRALALGF